MGHVVRNEAWGVVDLDTERGHVFVRQDWHYTWLNKSDVPPWTASEKATFHKALDRLIWAHWSFRTRIEARPVTGSAHSPPSYCGRGLTLSFDVRRVRVDPHWRVDVTKINPNDRPYPRARTSFEDRWIHLSSVDVVPVHASRFLGDPLRKPEPSFYVAPHEFGHALGYGYSRHDGEEYDADHPFFNDAASLMNIGRETRPRHVRLIVETLAAMVPGVEFVAVGVMQ